MKKILYLLLLCPFLVNAQVNGTIQITPATGIVRGSFGGSGLDTIPIVQLAAVSNGDLLKYNSTLKKWQNFTASFGTGTVTSVAALTLGTTGTDLTSSIANSTTTPVITLNVPTASATNRGALSSTDWSTFNNKGTGSVTSVSVTPANGVSGSVATATTTPAITLTLGAITPTTVTASNSITSNGGIITSNGSSNTSISANTSGTGSGASDVWFSTSRTDNTNGYSGIRLGGASGINWFAGMSRNTRHFQIVNATVAHVYPTGGNTIALDIDTLNNISAISLTTGGLVKSTASTGVLSNATAGTDYAPATSGTSILKGNGSGGFSSAVSNTDYLPVASPTFTGTMTGGSLVGTTATLTANGSIFGSTGISGSPLTIKGSTNGRAMDIVGRSNSGVDEGFIKFFKNDGTTLNGLIEGAGGNLYLSDATVSNVITLSGGNTTLLGTLIGAAATFSSTISASNLTSGIYTPTITNGANAASSVPLSCHYIRFGNQLMVQGVVNVTATLGVNTATVVTISLPVSSNIGAASDLWGNGTPGQITGLNPVIAGNASTDTASLTYTSVSAGATDIYFSFTYTII